MSAAAAGALDPEEIRKYLGVLDEMKSQYATLDEQVKTLGKPNSETIERMDKLNLAIIDLQGKHQEQAIKRIDAMEERLRDVAANIQGARQAKSLGQTLIDDERFLTFAKSGSREGFAMQLKGYQLFKKDMIDLGGYLQQRIPAVAVGPRLPLGVRTLVPQGTTTAGSLEFVREVSHTNNAAVVAEGAQKPKSDKTFETASSTVRTIAHFYKVSKQSYEDLPFLASTIEQNGIYGVQKVEDNELLNGTGIAPHLMGFNTVATAAPAAPVGGTLIDAIGYAVFDLAAKGFMPDGVVTNPANWGQVSLLKNSQGNYIFSNPVDYTGISRVWGLRHVNSSNQAAGTFLTGAFQGNSLLLDREEVNVQVASQNVDDFEKNMLTILIEERVALLIYTPAAFSKGVIPAAAIGELGGNEPANEGRRGRG